MPSQQVSPQLRQVSAAFHLTLGGPDPRRSTCRARCPSSRPGLRIAATISLLLAISAEFLGGTDGIGRNLFNALTVNNPDKMFVYAFTASSSSGWRSTWSCSPPSAGCCGGTPRSERG